MIVFVLIIVWGVYKTATSKPRLSGEKEHIDDDTAKDLLAVGIFAILGGLLWPIFVPIFTVAVVVVCAYKVIV